MNVDLSVLTISATKPNGKPAAMLAEMGITVVPIEEDEGDVDRYILSKRLAIDRRTGNSFLQGIMDKTLFTSAIYLREHFSIPILIVEGEVNYEYTMFDPQRVRGALSSMMLLYGVSVLSTPNIEETVNLIVMMARQEQTGIREISLIPKRKATDLADMQRRVIEMLPGCGMVTARDLLQYFGSVKRIVNATEEEFRSVPGIVAKKATEIYKVLNAEYESVDTEKNLEDAIEAVPELLFKQPVTLLDRQHYIYTEEKEGFDTLVSIRPDGTTQPKSPTQPKRHIVDLVFLDPEADELILVELKRGKLTEEHYDQICRYLDNANKSQLLRAFLEKGAKIRGMLATVEECKFEPKDTDVSVCIVDKKQTIEVLKQLRNRRLESMAAVIR